MWCSQLGKTIQPSDVLFNSATHFQRGLIEKSRIFLFFKECDIISMNTNINCKEIK